MSEEQPHQSKLDCSSEQEESTTFYELEQILDDTSDLKRILAILKTFLDMGATIGGRDLLAVLLPNINDEDWAKVYAPEGGWESKSKKPINMLIDVDVDTTIQNIQNVGRLLELSAQNTDFKRKGISSPRQRWTLPLDKRVVVMTINLPATDKKSEMGKAYFLHQTIRMKNNEKGVPELFFEYETYGPPKVSLLDTISNYFNCTLDASPYLQKLIKAANGQDYLRCDYSISREEREKKDHEHMILSAYAFATFIPIALKFISCEWEVKGMNIQKFGLKDLRERGIFKPQVPEIERINALDYDYDWNKLSQLEKENNEKRLKKCTDSYSCVSCKKLLQLDSDDQSVVIMGRDFIHERCTNSIMRFDDDNEEHIGFKIALDMTTVYGYSDSFKGVGAEGLAYLGLKKDTVSSEYTPDPDLSAEENKRVQVDDLYKSFLEHRVYESPLFEGCQIYGGHLLRSLSTESDDRIREMREGDIDIRIPKEKFDRFQQTIDEFSKLTDPTKMKVEKKGTSFSDEPGLTIEFMQTGLYIPSEEEEDKDQDGEKTEKLQSWGYRREKPKKAEEEMKITLDIHSEGEEMLLSGEGMFDAFPNVLTYTLGSIGRERLSVFSKRSTKISELTHLEVLVLALASNFNEVYLLNEELPTYISKGYTHHVRLFHKPLKMMGKNGWVISYDFLEWNALHPRYSDSWDLNEMNYTRYSLKGNRWSLKQGKEVTSIVKMDVFDIPEDATCSLCGERNRSKYWGYDQTNIWDMMLNLECGHVMCFRCLWFGKAYKEVMSKDYYDEFNWQVLKRNLRHIKCNDKDDNNAKCPLSHCERERCDHEVGYGRTDKYVCPDRFGPGETAKLLV